MGRTISLSVMLAFTLLSCDSKDETSNDVTLDLPSTDVSVDQKIKDQNTADVAKDILTSDTAIDLAKDVPSDLPPNQPLTLTRTKDGVEFPFTDFYYGKNVDETFRLEAFVKGTGSCPTMNDPSPDATMIITINPVDQTHKDAVILDFAGFFDTVNPSHPSTLIVSDFTFDAFGQTVGMHLSGVDKHDVSHFSFKGQVYATYCPSLDE